MGFFDNARKFRDSLTAVTADAWQNASPAAAKAKQLTESFVASVNQQATTTIIPDGVPTREVSPSDWAGLTRFGEDVGKHVGVTAGEAWEALLGGKAAMNEVGSKRMPKFDFKEEHMKGLSEKVLKWIRDYPVEAAQLIACLAAVPLATSLTPVVLGLIGFTPIGPAAGSLAAAVQSAIGPVAAGGAFAILQSAAMGGYGLAIVNALAATGAATGVCGIAAASFIRAMKEDAENEKKDA